MVHFSAKLVTWVIDCRQVRWVGMLCVWKIVQSEYPKGNDNFWLPWHACKDNIKVNLEGLILWAGLPAPAHGPVVDCECS
jgi:hypothetical protein